MTMRSKQWYTKTSRLSNSFANNSIGRLPDRASATRSSARRSVESTALLRARRGRKERDSKGKETVGFVPFGLRHKLRQTHASTRKPASSNFKYVWLALIGFFGAIHGRMRGRGAHGLCATPAAHGGPTNSAGEMMKLDRAEYPDSHRANTQ